MVYRFLLRIVRLFGRVDRVPEHIFVYLMKIVEANLATIRRQAYLELCFI